MSSLEKRYQQIVYKLSGERDAAIREVGDTNRTLGVVEAERDRLKAEVVRLTAYSKKVLKECEANSNRIATLEAAAGCAVTKYHKLKESERSLLGAELNDALLELESAIAAEEELRS